MGEKPSLAFDTTRVSGERSVGANHSMAWDDYRDRIERIRVPYSAARTSIEAQRFREFTVRDSGTRRNFAETVPYGFLKTRAAGVESETVEVESLGGKISPQSNSNCERVVALDEAKIAATPS